MRLASYTTHGRTSFGVVEGDGVIDVRLRLSPRFPTLLDVFRADALEKAVQGALASAGGK